MIALSRRHLLQASAASWWLAPLALAEMPPSRALILVQLAGGNDGLNTLAPLADPLYAKLRPSLALKPEETVDLGAEVALHAGLAPLLPRFKAGQLALLQGVGYPKPSRSHFEAIAVWQSGDLKAPPSGWVTRGLEKRAPASFSFVSLGTGGSSPALSTSGRPPTALASLDAFSAQPDRRNPTDAPALLEGLSAIYGASDANDGAGLVRRVGRAGLLASDELKHSASSYATRQVYPRGPFGDQLKLALQLLTSPLGVRVVHVVLGGFDTHANQRRQHQTLLETLGQGIAAVLGDAEEHEIADRLLVMTYSEFGRRVAENGSQGTDHGAGSVMLVAGAGVKGGLLGHSPQLAHLDQGDVPVTLDFRAAYSSVLKDWFGAPLNLGASDTLKLT
jgi:uncharacterized protein (DUF1501 family)